MNRALSTSICLGVLLGTLPVRADDVPRDEQEERCNLTCRLGRDFKSFGTARHTATLLGVGLGLSLLARSADTAVSESRINSELYPDTALDRLPEPGEIGGGTPVQLGAAVGTLAVGRLARLDTVSKLGSALVRAQVVNGVVSTAMKFGVRRERPDGSDRRSFPSGHTSGSFATATILRRELGWKMGAPAFAFAGLVGASRLSENRHHLSDVVLGAALGIAAGLSVGIEDEASPVQVRPQIVQGGVGLQLFISLP